MHGAGTSCSESGLILIHLNEARVQEDWKGKPRRYRVNPPKRQSKGHVDFQKVPKLRHVFPTCPRSSRRCTRWKEKKKVARIRKTVTIASSLA